PRLHAGSGSRHLRQGRPERSGRRGSADAADRQHDGGWFEGRRCAMSTDYPKLAKALVARAKKQGAQQSEVFLQVGRESSVRVRDGEIEDLTQATSKGVGIRVIVKDRLGFAFTSDFDPASLNTF